MAGAVKLRDSRFVRKPRIKSATAKAKNRVELVMLTLGQRIVSSVYPPDSALPTEPQLSKELRVGRNAIREAIKMLASKGFLRTSRRAGTLVLPVSRWSMLDPEVLRWILKDRRIRDKLIEDLTTVRRIIEPEVAALAASHASAKDTLKLFDAFEAMEKAIGDRDAAIAADVSFHERLFEAAHNPLLTSLSQAFAVLLHANFEIAIERKNAFVRNLSGHGRVAEAVHRRDAVDARREMLQLLDNNDEDIHQMMHGDAASAAESRR